MRDEKPKGKKKKSTRRSDRQKSERDSRVAGKKQRLKWSG